MDPKKQPDALDRSKPQFRLGQEAVEGAEKDSKKQQPVPEHKHSATLMPVAINKPLMECYPEIADDEDEQLLADVRRHWLGRVGILFAGSLLIFMLVLFAISSPSLLRGAKFAVSGQLEVMIGVLSITLAVVVALGTFITLWIYQQSHMLITNENIIEVRQINLFSKKVSHLNMINVEDVTVLKHGILQTAFNYGTMSIETAGEKDNFTFPNTPDPDIYRRLVINAHEDAIDRVGHLGIVPKVMIAENGI